MRLPVGDLLLATLQRASTPLGSDDLLDAATGLARSAGWCEDDLRPLTRRRIAATMRTLVASGQAREAGSKFDDYRRPSPIWDAPDAYDKERRVPIPEPPAQLPEPDPKDAAADRRTALLLELGEDAFAVLASTMAQIQKLQRKARLALEADDAEPVE